jgi:flavodoxin
MKFKMRVLHYSPAGNAEKISRAIAKAQEAKCDQIPPAYPSESEKLIFIGMELKGSSAHKTVVDLCRDLNPSRGKNVAFFVVGNGNLEAIESLKKIVEGQGLQVVGDTYQCIPKGGLFKKTISDEDVANAVEWAAKIVDSLAV